MNLTKQKKLSICIATGLCLVAIFGCILVKTFDPEEVHIFIPCFTYQLTGVKCPGCGMTRAMHQLLSGHIKEALSYNIMCFPIIGMVIYTIYRYIHYLITDEEIVNQRMLYILYVFIACLLSFGFIRNFIGL